MCGLFGAFGEDINVGTIRALAIANRERGTDGIGFFDSSGKFIKSGDDALFALGEKQFSQFLAHRKRWFIAGHTRAATRGSVCKRNAHPFRYGSIIGAHNGVVCAPSRYRVDSEYLFDRLAQCNGDYQKALENVRGHWALSWFDGDSFYLHAYSNELYVTEQCGTFYYSSDVVHLEACCGSSASLMRIGSGAVMHVSSAGFEMLSSLVVNSKPARPIAPDYFQYDSLARRFGYDSLDDLCKRERVRRSVACDMLDDCIKDDHYDVWDEYVRDYR